jgi:hypothetical protein
MSDSEGRCLGAKKVREVHVTQRSSDPNRQRHWRYGWGFAGIVGALTVVLAGCSGAHSESPAPVVVTNTNLPVTVTNAASPFVIAKDSGGPALNSGTASLPASTGLYQFESFYYDCASPGVQPSNLLLEVLAGPDAGIVLALPYTPPPVAYNGGGLVKFWLRPLDQIQVSWNGLTGAAVACSTYLYGEVVAGTLQTLQ